MKTHILLKRHKCPYCASSTDTEHGLVKHIANCHGDDVKIRTVAHVLRGLLVSPYDYDPENEGLVDFTTNSGMRICQPEVVEDGLHNFIRL